MDMYLPADFFRLAAAWFCFGLLANIFEISAKEFNVTIFLQ